MEKQFLCPRRAESPLGASPMFARDNDWDPVDDDCRYCGSLAPDTFMARVEAGDITLGTTDKSYKVYVHNAGGEALKPIKFYFQHLDATQQSRFVELMNEPGKLRFKGGHGFYVLPFFAGRKAS